MSQEDKELLLKDLCARLPYGLYVQVEREPSPIHLNYNDVHFENYFNSILNGDIKPYLRPMSSMTEEERKESREWLMLSSGREGNRYFDGFGNVSAADVLKGIDWLNSHHFDYRGLIEKGLAIEAPKDMYKN